MVLSPKAKSKFGIRGDDAGAPAATGTMTRLI
jgi:hypothetical protein